VAVLALRRDPWVRAGMAGSPLMLNTIRKRLISPRTPLITLEVEVRLTKVQREEHPGRPTLSVKRAEVGLRKGSKQTWPTVPPWAASYAWQPEVNPTGGAACAWH